MTISLNSNASLSYPIDTTALKGTRAEDYFSDPKNRAEFLSTLQSLKDQHGGQSTPVLDRFMTELAQMPADEPIPQSYIGNIAADLLAEILKNFQGGRDVIEKIKEWFAKGGGADLLKKIEGGMHAADAIAQMLKMFGVPMEAIQAALKLMDDCMDSVKRFLKDIGVDPERHGGGGETGDRKVGDSGNLRKDYTPYDLVRLAEGDIETAVMAAYIGRAQMQETQLMDQLKTIQARNASIAELNDVSAKIRAWAKDHKDANGNVNLNNMPNINGRSVVEILKSYGITFADATKVDPSGLCDNTIKATIDNLNSTQQLEMTRMQSLMNKRNEAYDMVTNFVKNCHDKISTVISNMR